MQLRIYVLISIILISILIYNVARGALSLNYGLLGLFIGIGIGIITSRMFHISWNKDAQKVVSRLDTFGIVILILYILFEIFKEKLVGYITHDVQVATTGFAILAGNMFGRIIGTRGKIMHILKEQKVFG